MTTETEQQIQLRELEQRALDLRRKGVHYRDVASELHISLHRAHALVQKALSRIADPDAAEVKKLELERLDAMQAGLWAAATNGGYLSVDRVLGIMERRAALMGLDVTDKPDVLVLVQAVYKSANESGLSVEEILAQLSPEMQTKLRPMLQIEGPKE